MRRVFILIFYILITGLLGYVRDFFFLDVNYLMYYKYYHSQKPWLTEPAAWTKAMFGTWSYSELYFMKYPATFFFSFLFFVAGCGLLVLLEKKYLIRYFVSFYFFLFLLAGILTVLGVLVWSRWDSAFYYLARRWVGMEQSPVPALLVYASGVLFEKFRHKN